MLMPSIFGENLFDDWFDEFPFYDMDKEMNNTEKKLYGKKAGRIMKTDIKEQKDGYELMIDLPGFTKDEIKASVSDGYLTISAAKGLDKDEKEKDSGHYIRRERYAGACQRSFYVGEDIEQEDVKAEFKHGILKLFVPKCNLLEYLTQRDIQTKNSGVNVRYRGKHRFFKGFNEFIKEKTRRCDNDFEKIERHVFF